MDRLIDVLRTRGLTGNAARDALRSGKVSVRGVPVALASRWVEASEVAVVPNAPRITVGRDMAFVYRDEHLAVVYKPAGMLSVPAPRAGGHQNLVGLAGRLLGAAFAVHRLDEDTSGLLLVARTTSVQTALKDALERHDVERRYLALVSGRPNEGEHTIRSFIARDRGDGKRGRPPADLPVPADAREAVTTLRMLGPLGPHASLVEAQLHTGRTHQVRIHLAESGHPVLGDALYGGPGMARRAPRLALHAAVLGFHHPILGKTLRFDAPLADDLEALRERLVRGEG